MCKVGYYMEEGEPLVFPTILGNKKTGEYVGDEAKKECAVNELKYPIERGIITDWTAMERIWHQIFYNKLRVEPEKCPVLLTEPSLNPRANREKITKIMFNTFGVPKMSLVTK